MICLTAFYFMNPQQKIVEGRCISPLAGSFVAFDIVKVNPFNQSIQSDPRLASLFYRDTPWSTRLTTKHIGSTKAGRRSAGLGLTLANVQLHDRHALTTSRSFLPKVNRLVEMVNRRAGLNNSAGKSEDGTVFQDPMPVFEALYRMEISGDPFKNDQDCETAVCSEDARNDRPRLEMYT